MLGSLGKALQTMFGPKPKATNRLISRIDSEMKLFEELGSGRFGVVRKGIQRHALHNEAVAVKIVPKSRASLRDVQNEIKVLEKLRQAGNCPNVMHLTDAFEDRYSVYMVTPLYAGGELFDRISQQRVFTEADASTHMLDLLNGIKFCHNNLIAHRDVKPENLLFSVQDKLVLIDFGMARMCNDKEEEMDLQCGSPSYVAPEVLNRNYTMKCDLWSCGIILHILLVGGTPFGNGTDDEILTRVEHFNSEVFLNNMNLPEWDTVSNQAKDLCIALLTKDCVSRLDANASFERVLSWKQASEEVSKDSTTGLRMMENLKQFNSFRRLKKATIHFIADLIRKSEANNTEQAEAKRLADTIASLGNGKQVPLAELAKKLHITENAFDGNLTNTAVNAKDLIASALTKSVLLDEQYLLKAFQSFDKSGDGLLDYNELAAVLGKDPLVDKDFVKEALEHADTDGNGFISFDEFATSVREKSVVSNVIKKRELTFT